MWFVPGSAMTDEQRAHMPTEVALRFPAAIFGVLKQLHSNSDVPIYNLDGFFHNASQLNNAQRIGGLFAAKGSDKSTVHNYHFLYGAILAFLSSSCAPLKILEIGLGTSNINVASNMGSNGVPGASLRAFKAYSQDFIIHGADIDTEIGITDFTVFYIDQTNPSSFKAISDMGELRYDLIIDDGLHSPDANLFTIQFALTRISANGYLVIEDIRPEAIDIWKSLYYIFTSKGYSFSIFKARVSYVVVISPNSKLSFCDYC